MTRYGLLRYEDFSVNTGSSARLEECGADDVLIGMCAQDRRAKLAELRSKL